MPREASLNEAYRGGKMICVKSSGKKRNFLRFT